MFLLPALSFVFSAGGLFGATGAIAAGIGGTLGAVVGGALMGATIGAAIGGLGALVTGGDIGKGMLVGALGGAVTGGIGGWMQAGSFANLGAGEGISNAVSSSGFTDSAMMAGKTISSTGVVKDTVAAGAANIAKESATGTLLSKLGEEGMGALVEGGIGLVGNTLSGMGEQKRWEAEMDAQIAEAEKQRQHEMKMLQSKLSAGGGGGGGGGSDRDWAAELAENRRQFDAELNQRKAEFAKSMDIRKQELYAPMEFQKEKTKRAAGALSSVGVERGQYQQNPTIQGQLQQVNEYPDPVQGEQPAPAPVPQEDDR